MTDIGPFRGPVEDALTTICGRCNGTGTESHQVSRDPKAGREEWPCNRCSGKGSLCDGRQVGRVLSAIKAVLDGDEPPKTAVTEPRTRSKHRKPTDGWEIDSLPEAQKVINIQHRMLCKDAEAIAELHQRVAWLALPWRKRIRRRRPW